MLRLHVWKKLTSDKISTQKKNKELSKFKALTVDGLWQFEFVLSPHGDLWTVTKAMFYHSFRPFSQLSPHVSFIIKLLNNTN